MHVSVQGALQAAGSCTKQPSVCPDFALMLVGALQAEVSANTSCTVTGECVGLDFKGSKLLLYLNDGL